MLPLFAVVALLALVAVAGSGVSPSLSGGGSAVSALRKRALDIIAEVVPSAQGDARFAKLGWAPQPGSNATSCGALPGYMGVHLGDPTGITRWGVQGARDQGIAKGAWRASNGSRRPKPGDIYASTKTPGGSIVHVGVFVRRYVDEQGREVWVTADSGQGPDPQHQAAAYVPKVYDPRSNTVQRLDFGEPRVIDGWIDLDAWPFPPSKVAHLVSPADAWRYQENTPCDPAECGPRS